MIPSTPESFVTTQNLNPFSAESTRKLPLYDFQEEIVEFMVQRSNCINASFCGSGKTLTSLAVIKELESKENLIVCPKSVHGNWVIEINKWLPGSKVFSVGGNKIQRQKIYAQYKQAEGEKFLLITYDTLRIDKDILLML